MSAFKISRHNGIFNWMAHWVTNTVHEIQTNTNPVDRLSHLPNHWHCRLPTPQISVNKLHSN